MRKSWFASVLAVAGLALLSSAANADPIVESGTGNECGGRGGFQACTYEGSPTIIKFNYDDEEGFSVDDINALFPTIDGSEFTLTCTAANCSTGTWVYAPGDGDPTITHYIASSANQFNAFQNDDPILSGAWSVPTGQTLSHLTFFDTDGGQQQVAEPTSLALIGIALVGLAATRRRR